MTCRFSGWMMLVAAAAIWAAVPLPAAAQMAAGNQVVTRTTFRDVAKKVMPGVVNIKIKSGIQFNKPGGPGGRQVLPPGMGMEDEMRDYLERLFEQQMPNLSPNDEENFRYARNGSGVIVRADGVVVTSNHVVAGVEDGDIEVCLPDGRTFSKVKVLGRDELTDLAVLKAEEAQDLPTVAWGDSDKMETGDIVMTVGNPLEFNNSVSEGIISAKHRVIRKAPIEDLIQTTAVINPGNSGGALVNLDGELVGINMAIATNTGMWNGLGFAIPSRTAKEVTDQIVINGKVARGYLGIEMATLTNSIAKQMKYQGNVGIVVKNVRPGSASDKAGLQRYDIIAKVNGKDIKEINDMHRGVGGRAAGESVDLEVWRDEGQDVAVSKRITVTLDERPTEDELLKKAPAPKLPGREPAPDNLLGMELKPSADDRGVFVENVKEASKAALGGLQRGDIILQVNRVDVKTQQDVQKALTGSRGDSHLFFIERGGQSSMITILSK